MHAEIDQLLANPPEFRAEADLRAFMADVKQRMLAYERSLLEEGAFTADAELLINAWRRKTADIILESRKRLARSETGGKHDDIFETVKLMSRQIDKADANLQLLDRSSLKLVGLNYSSRDIENEIGKTRDALAKSKMEERREVMLVYLGILVLLLVCLLILVDKFIIG